MNTGEFNIEEIIHPDIIHKFHTLTMGIAANTFRDGVKSPEGMRYVHLRDELLNATQLPTHYVRAMAEYCETLAIEGGP